MAVAHVQSNSTGASASSSFISLSGVTVGSGDCVVGAVTWGSATVTLTGVADNLGNALIVSDTNVDAADVQTTASFILGNSAASSTIKASFSAAVGTRAMGWSEYSGTLASSDPRDGHQVNFQSTPATTSSAVTSSAITTTGTGDLIWGWTTNNISSNHVATAGSSFTRRVSDTTVIAINSEDLIVQSSAGSVAATWTSSAATDARASFIIAIKAAAASSIIEAYDSTFIRRPWNTGQSLLFGGWG